jgi:hypothetical protein
MVRRSDKPSVITGSRASLVENREFEMVNLIPEIKSKMRLALMKVSYSSNSLLGRIYYQHLWRIFTFKIPFDFLTASRIACPNISVLT